MFIRKWRPTAVATVLKVLDRAYRVTAIFNKTVVKLCSAMWGGVIGHRSFHLLNVRNCRMIVIMENFMKLLLPCRIMIGVRSY